MFSYFYIFFFFSHGRSVVSLSHLYISFFRCRCRRDLSRLVFLGNQRIKMFVSSTSRSVYGSSDERKARHFCPKMRESLKREKSGKRISRKYLIRGSLFDSFAISWVGSSIDRRLASAERLCTLSHFACARSLASR